MIYLTVICVISFIYVGIKEFLFMQERKLWQSERQTLLDRIQAKDFPEYKAFEPKPEKKKNEDKPKQYELL